MRSPCRLAPYFSHRARPDLVIRPDDLTITARELRTIISRSGEIFDRAGPVLIRQQPNGMPPIVVPLGVDGIVNLAHQLARPVGFDKVGRTIGRTLPDRVARLYLALNDWNLRPLKGITTAPLLAHDGSIGAFDGYDVGSGLWCAGVPPLAVPDRPTAADARAALQTIRESFRTFPFADAPLTQYAGITVPVVDLSAPPGKDESAFLVALLTAVCRPSLPLAPGILIVAPRVSGSGTGKGKLFRAICLIAHGVEPNAFTAGENLAELGKRLEAAIIHAKQGLFLDNVNSRALQSDVLASMLTEPLIDIRPLGTSRMLSLTPNAIVGVTGSGLRVIEDLFRRFILIELDAHMETPAERSFSPGFLTGLANRRAELLTSALTIWRWGRQNESGLTHGRPLGSYEEWGLWVRDPLLTLGCADPAARISAVKAQDPLRRALAGIYGAWWAAHGPHPVKASDLAEPVRALIDPLDRGRQFVSSYLDKHVGTCINGLVLTSQKPAGKWGTIVYALQRVPAGPIPPTPPMPMGPPNSEN
jgi:hypothetical protein